MCTFDCELLVLDASDISVALFSLTIAKRSIPYTSTYTRYIVAGKRVCAGETFARQNMLLFLMTMMQHFTLELPEGQALPDLEDHLPGLNTSPRPFNVKMVPR